MERYRDWEKRFTLQQAQESVVYPPTGSPTVKQQAPMYHNMIKAQSGYQQKN